jgi:hypothetical protein
MGDTHPLTVKSRPTNPRSITKRAVPQWDSPHGIQSVARLLLSLSPAQS